MRNGIGSRFMHQLFYHQLRNTHVGNVSDFNSVCHSKESKIHIQRMIFRKMVTVAPSEKSVSFNPGQRRNLGEIDIDFNAWRRRLRLKRYQQRAISYIATNHEGLGEGGTRELKRGTLHLDRDYHVHLGGAITKDLIIEWEKNGLLDLDEEIDDLVSGNNSRRITVRRALEQYRVGYEENVSSNADCESKLLLSSYYQKPYPSLPIFLTLYRAYSRRNTVLQNASQIAMKGIHPDADVRMSLPCPSSLLSSSSSENSANGKDLSPAEYALLAMKEMEYFRDCIQCSPPSTLLLISDPPMSSPSTISYQGRRLVITIPRQTFNSTKHYDYFVAFVDLLKSLHFEYDRTNSSDNSSPTSLPPPLEPIFDFAGEPLHVDKTLPLLKYIRHCFPSKFSYVDDADSNYHISETVKKTKGCTILYHHGEITPHIPLQQRVEDAIKLLPYINRMGHAICLGIALQQHQHRKNNESKKIVSMAKNCLKEMCFRDIGIEVTPSCNLSLGGAHNLEYVKMFLDAGVDVYVGTDDPGFTGSTFVEEARLLWDVAN
mmetsp:Transcript_25742/g.38024  ORF Transcript_25742/g.38024 Transcript_25742/m.38024 type:complete len:544 (-) Transcript_25742:159-1790(-)